MKNYLKYFILSFGFVLFTTSCDEGLVEVNENPNVPTVVPTGGLFNSATKELMDQTRDEWFSGRLTLEWMQYGASTAYTEEARFQYRETQADQGYDLFRIALDFKSIIDLNTAEATKGDMAAYGNNDNQIAASRIMLSYIFAQLTETYGDIPYYSYGNSNEDFQALQSAEYLQPKYVSQSVIYEDILKELKEAANMLNTSESVFYSGDAIYNGNAENWKKFANSLRLRYANRIKSVYTGAAAEMTDAISSGVFTSNEDNASQKYENNLQFGNPFYIPSVSRSDFAVANTFVDLLKGDLGIFGHDPRLQKMISPKAVVKTDVFTGTYEASNDLDDYEGMPYGIPNAVANLEFDENTISFFATPVFSANASEILMEYAEVQFLISEANDWDQTYYENGVEASMEKWGVDAAEISAFIENLPEASEENVMNQKYIALYMQPHEAWSEYRRTGFPNTILEPGDSYTLSDGTTMYTFEPLVSVDKLPYRMTYPFVEQTLNSDNRASAVSSLSNGDAIDSKLWWMP